MSGQLLGVLREVVSGTPGRPFRPVDGVQQGARSTFGVDLLVAHTDVYLDGRPHSEKLTAEIVSALPVPLVDPNDVGANMLSAIVLSQPIRHWTRCGPPGTEPWTPKVSTSTSPSNCH